MKLIVLSICLVLLNGENIPKIIDDELEQSGDDEIGAISFTTQQTVSHISSNDDEITKAFANQHQKQPNQTNQHTKSDKTARTQSKGKQQTRKHDLNDDVNDFVDLIPKAEVKAKIEEYYRNDMDVQHIFEYMHGKEFLELRKNLLELSDVKEILQHLNKNGFNVKSILRKLDNRLGVSKILSTQLAYNPQPSFGTNTTIGGFSGLVEDVFGLLPQDEIFIIFFEKLDSSPKFASFIQSFRDPTFYRKYSTLLKSKELNTAGAQLKKHKIDLPKILQIVQGYFILGTF